jgi:hypothetical protein
MSYSGDDQVTWKQFFERLDWKSSFARLKKISSTLF